MRFAYLIEPPFNFRGGDGIATGCDVELARHALQELGVEAHEFVEAEFAELLPGLGNHRWDMTTGLFATEQRRSIAAFSRPIWVLPDGLLVRKSNPLGLTGYLSVASERYCRLAVVRDQVQHSAATDALIPENRLVVFDTYGDAANAVRNGKADAFASVARAHAGYLSQLAEHELEVVTVPVAEKKPAAGSFGFRRDDQEFVAEVDEILSSYLGSTEHRRMMASYGFADEDIDLLVDW
ncbi:MAG: transporter substrate-binding domain-containing protein [Hyphomicrobiales bacterium]|nr:transporter substrate-binding domain-containing protein [Hyphomicrobiales bacterium]